jgi:MFS family permease
MAGRLMTNVGFFMVVPFITVFVVQHEHMTGAKAGLLFSTLLFTRRGFGLPAGWASDRAGPANTLSSGLSIESIAYLTFAFAGSSFVFWMAAAALLGTGGALNNNGTRSLISGADRSTSAIKLAHYYASVNAAGVVGPLLGTLLLVSGLMRVGFVVAAALHALFALASFVLLRHVPRHSSPTSDADPSVLTVFQDRPALAYCGTAVGSWALISLYRIVIPLDLIHQHLSADLVGPLTSLNAIVVMTLILVFSPWLGRAGMAPRLTALSAGAVVLGGGWLLCAGAGLLAIVAAVIVTSVGEALFCGVVDPIIVTFAPDGRVGLYLGLSALSWGVGGAVAGLSGWGLSLASRHHALTFFWLGIAGVGILTATATRLARPYFIRASHSREGAKPL